MSAWSSGKRCYRFGSYAYNRMLMLASGFTLWTAVSVLATAVRSPPSPPPFVMKVNSYKCNLNVTRHKNKIRWFARTKNAKIQFCEWAEQRAGWDSLVCSRTVSQTDWKCDLPLVKKSVPSKNNQNHIIKIISKSGSRPGVCKLAVKSRRSWLRLTAGRGGIRSCTGNTRQKEVQSLVFCTGIPFTFRAQSVHCTEQTAD